MKFVQNHDFSNQEQKTNHVELIKALGEIGGNVKKILTVMEKEYQTQSEMLYVALNPSYVPFAANGYKFNSLFVTDAQASATMKLVIQVFGGTYTITLSAGENIVNIPEGAQISVTNNNNASQSFLLQRFNFLKQ